MAQFAHLRAANRWINLDQVTHVDTFADGTLVAHLAVVAYDRQANASTQRSLTISPPDADPFLFALHANRAPSPARI